MKNAPVWRPRWCVHSPQPPDPFSNWKLLYIIYLLVAAGCFLLAFLNWE